MSLDTDQKEYVEDWLFVVQHDSHEYRVVWAGYATPEGVDTHQLLIYRDGEQIVRDEDISAIREAAVTFRLFQLSKEYSIDPFTILAEQPVDDLSFDLDDELLGAVEFSDHETAAGSTNDELLTQQKDTILAIFNRSLTGEYMGQHTNDDLYVQTVASILGTPEPDIWKAITSLQKEEKLGLIGAVLVPYETQVAHQENNLEETGHREFTVTDLGQWHCEYCGADGVLADDPDSDTADPKKVSCEEDKYKTPLLNIIDF